MDKKYKNWIKDHVEDPDILCNEYSFWMQSEFPELDVVHGQYCLNDEAVYHTWCITKEGLIVDPTADQYSPGGEYKPLIKGERFSFEQRKLAEENARKLLGRTDDEFDVHLAWATLIILCGFAKVQGRKNRVWGALLKE